MRLTLPFKMFAKAWSRVNDVRRGWEKHMIDFNEEIIKFQPSLEIDQAEEAIFNNDLTDISDILDMILNSTKDTVE